MVQTVSILVKGKVQGVFYRQSTKEKALQAGVTGFVKNQSDGNVYIEASGSKEQIDMLVAWCHQGPSRAVVANVHVEQIAYKRFYDFKVER